MRTSRNKILLIEPPFYRLFKDTYSLNRYPLALGYLACTIRKEANWDVMVCNSDFYSQSEWIKVGYLMRTGFANYLNNLRNRSAPIWKEVESTISDYNPSVVGISSKSQNFASACQVAEIAKEVDERIITIVGGPHTSMVLSKALDCAHIDVAVRGEGEITIVELLNAIDAQAEFSNIAGISYRKHGQVIENPPRQYIEDLDSLCFPHQSAREVLKDYDQYPLTAFQHIFSARGCPYNCFFCGSREIWSRKVRFRSVKNVVNEIKLLQEMGLKGIIFDDDTFGVTKKRINELCNALTEYCPGLRWGCEMPIQLVDEPTISIMKAAGCYTIQVGVESGNNEILRKIRKNITIEEAYAACEIIKSHGIDLQTFFILGFPQDTEETLNDTVEAMKKVKSNSIIYNIYTPYPGTEAFEFCKENGLVDDDYDISLYNHQSPANYFCINIERQRLKMLTSRAAKVVDRRNKLARVKAMFSFKRKLWRVQQLGVRRSLNKILKLFFSR